MTSLASPAPTVVADTVPVLELRGERTSPRVLARDIWRARELLVLLSRKEFHVKYRRMSFGTMWAVVLPLLQSALMAVVFTKLVRFHIPHYAMFVLSGMVAWTYFSNVFAAGSVAIASSVDLSTKVYFPRAMLGLVQVATALYGYFIMLAIVLLLGLPLGASLGPATLLLVPATVLLVVFSTSLTLTACALHVYFRDVGYIVNAAVLFLMYLSPIVYPIGQAPHLIRPVLAANPLTGILDMFHAAMGVPTPLVAGLAVTAVWTVALSVVAVALHSRFDRVFTDLL
jgi:ABC-type polysaccharide/polyol phosphate export permease